MMFDRTAERFAFLIRTLLLIICCVLIMPQLGQVHTKKGPLGAHLCKTSLTLAITGISSPISAKTLLDNDRPSLRSPGKRPSSFSIVSCSDNAQPAVLPSLPVLVLGTACEYVSFSELLLPLLSHQVFSWFALAPPASLNA